MIRRLFLFAFALFVLPLSVVSDVVINEFNYDPIDMGEDAGSLREFIELHNPGPDAVDLSGYAFTEGIQFTFPDGASIGSGAYIVVARVPSDSYWRGASYPVFGPYEGKISNGGEELELRRADGSLVEWLIYDDDLPWPRGADGYGPSIERIAWDLPAHDFHSWRASFSEGGTPGRVNSVIEAVPRPLMRSVEVLPQQPTSSDEALVRVELDTPGLIENVYLHWEANEDAPPQGIVNTADEWRYWKGESAPSSGDEWTETGFDDSAWPVGRGGFGYGDTDEVETLLNDMRGNYITFFLRHTFTVDDPGALGDLSLSLFFDDGFICYINGVEAARSHAPDTYTYESRAGGSHESTDSESFFIGSAADLLQPGENVIALVGFNVSRDNSSDFVLAPTLISSSLNNSGSRVAMTHAGDFNGLAMFEGSIPPQPNQTLVRFNVRVELIDGQTTRLPYTTERRPFESYFVYDNDIPTQLPILWIFPDKMTRLPERPRTFSGVVVKPLGDEPVQVFDGALISQSRNGEKIKFIKGEEFRGDRTINLSLESPREGTTAGGQSPHVEEISYKLFDDFGALTPRCDWYRVIENNEHQQRIAVQQPNERFLEINGRNPDGDIYKIAYNEPGGYSKKTNLDEGVDDYVELFNQVTIRNRRSLAEDIKTYLDYDEVMGYNVATFVMSHWDGIKNNIFLYHDPAPGGKWEVIPWDVDKTFGYTDSNPMYWQMPIDFFITLQAPGSAELTNRNLDGPIIRPFHSIPEYHQEFVNHVAESLDGLFSMERVGGMIDQREELLLADLDLIEGYTGGSDNSRRRQITESYDVMRFFLTKRHEFLRTQLPAGFTAEREVPASDFHAGDLIAGFRVVVNPLEGKTIQASVLEQVPPPFVITDVSATHGEATGSDGSISWNTGDISEPATLSYSIQVPESDLPPTLTIEGVVTVLGVNYSLIDAELRYLPDNVSSPDPVWRIGAGGEWTVIDGVMNAYADSGLDPKHAWVELDLGTDDYTVKADVRMVDWVDGDLARAGVAARVDPGDGERALNLLFHDDFNSVDMLSDLVAWGPNGDYAWQPGEWHTMTLTVEGDSLQGQIVKTNSKMAPMVLEWSGPPVATRASGYPGLTASTLEGLTAQYDNYEVIVNGETVFFDDFEEDTGISDWEVY